MYCNDPRYFYRTLPLHEARGFPSLEKTFFSKRPRGVKTQDLRLLTSGTSHPRHICLTLCVLEPCQSNVLSINGGCEK